MTSIETATPITRRAVLRGLGTLVSLPFFESLVPRSAFGDAPVAHPTRLGFAYVPNGVNWRTWHIEPPAAGKDFALSPTLQVLAPVRSHVSFFRGLTLDQGRAHGDGGGDHPRATASFLTAAHAHKNFGRQVHVRGISLDQFAAQRIGNLTRLPSLELACERPQPPSMCDAGYSGVYRNSVAWRTPHTPVPAELNPRLVFFRLFGDPRQSRNAQGRGRDHMVRTSILDSVMDEARILEGSLGGADRARLDEYLTSVRAVEQQIQAAERIPVRTPPPATTVPDGIPPEVVDHVRVMLDLMVLAFQTDSTRLCSVMLAMGGSDRSFPWLGVRGGHHGYSHHERKPENLDAWSAIDRFYVEQFGYLVARLAAIREGNGTLLDHSLLLYGSPLCDGNLHSREDLPVLLAGRGNGAVSPGRLHNYPRETPLANLFVNLLNAAGIRENRFSDSTGPLRGLAG